MLPKVKKSWRYLQFSRSDWTYDYVRQIHTTTHDSSLCVACHKRLRVLWSTSASWCRRTFDKQSGRACTAESFRFKESERDLSLTKYHPSHQPRDIVPCLYEVRLYLGELFVREKAASVLHPFYYSFVANEWYERFSICVRKKTMKISEQIMWVCLWSRTKEQTCWV